MSVSAETYIVISLMFAVFAAVAAVGTSVVLGAGFERLRAGFEVVKRQSGFFADAIYRLDQKTQRLDEEQSKFKSHIGSVGERVDRAEKQIGFIGDAMGSLEQRILQGSPTRMNDDRPDLKGPSLTCGITMARPSPAPQSRPVSDDAFSLKPFEPEMDTPIAAPGAGHKAEAISQDNGGLTTLLSRYLSGEQSGGKGIIYH